MSMNYKYSTISDYSNSLNIFQDDTSDFLKFVEYGYEFNKCLTECKMFISNFFKIDFSLWEEVYSSKPDNFYFYKSFRLLINKYTIHVRVFLNTFGNIAIELMTSFFNNDDYYDMKSVQMQFSIYRIEKDLFYSKLKEFCSYIYENSFNNSVNIDLSDLL